MWHVDTILDNTALEISMSIQEATRCSKPLERRHDKPEREKQ